MMRSPPFMPRVFSDDQWDDLLDFIEQGKVLPIIGEGAVVFGKDEQPLYPWLARELAGKLEIPLEELPPSFGVSEVAHRHLMRGGERNAIYSRLHRILKNTPIEPGAALLHLAEVEAFQLFLSTTFDPLLERALNRMRYGGAEISQSKRGCAHGRMGAPQPQCPSRRPKSVFALRHYVRKRKEADGRYRRSRRQPMADRRPGWRSPRVPRTNRSRLDLCQRRQVGWMDRNRKIGNGRRSRGNVQAQSRVKTRP